VDNGFFFIERAEPGAVAPLATLKRRLWFSAPCDRVVVTPTELLEDPVSIPVVISICLTRETHHLLHLGMRVVLFYATEKM